MGRTILPGSRVQIVAAPRPVSGSIWAYCDRDGRILVHRCLARHGAAFVFQGDGSPVLDPLVSPQALIGAVVAIEHGGRVKRLGLRDRLVRGLPRRLRYQCRRLLAAARARIRRTVDG